VWTAAAPAALAVLLGLAMAQPAAADADCSPAAIAKQRQAFAQAYKAKYFAAASSVASKLWNACMIDEDHPADPVLRAEISNDAALAAHRSGDDGECLQWLLDYLPAPRTGNKTLDRLPPWLHEAILFNYRLCKPYCATAWMMDPSCMSITASEELDRMMISDFAEKPCPFDTGGSPTLALPDNSCLALYAPDPLTPDEAALNREDQPPDKVCPRVALVSRHGDGLDSRTLTVPPHSLLRRISVCCSAIDLAMDHAGRIEVTPADNPPEHCLSGHRYSAQQDVFELRDGALQLHFQLDTGGE
jgi:hypothetical protein